MKIAFEDFLKSVPEAHRDFVAALHKNLMEQDADCSIKEAKSGYALSYKWQGKSVMNWVFRKSGILARIYGDHVGGYEPLIAALPTDMQKKMTASRDCKRHINPEDCSPTCVMGFVYHLNGREHKKCRNDGMLFPLTDGSAPHIEALVCAELSARQGNSQP